MKKVSEMTLKELNRDVKIDRYSQVIYRHPIFKYLQILHTNITVRQTFKYTYAHMYIYINII